MACYQTSWDYLLLWWQSWLQESVVRLYVGEGLGEYLYYKSWSRLRGNVQEGLKEGLEYQEWTNPGWQTGVGLKK
jgi:hypothetical protein